MNFSFEIISHRIRRKIIKLSSKLRIFKLKEGIGLVGTSGLNISCYSLKNIGW